MQKKFFSNLLLLVALNLLIKPAAIFGIDMTVQNRVGSEAYGFYFSLLNLSLLFNILLDLGINNYTIKNMAQFPKAASSYLGRIFTFRLVLFLVYALVTFGAALILDYGPEHYHVLTVLVFNQLLAVFIGYFRGHFSGLLLFKWDAIFSVLDRLLIVIVGAALLWFTRFEDFKIEWFVYLQTSCYGLSFAVAAWVLFQRLGRPKITWKPLHSLVIIRSSLPFALLILLMMIYTRQDSIMLERLHPEGELQAGVYAQGFRLLDAVYMFGMLFTTLLFPLFSKQIGNIEANRSLFLLAVKLLTTGAIILGGVMHFHGEDVLQTLYHDVHPQSYPSFRLLMWSFVAMSLSLILGTYLTALGEMKFLNQVAFFGILVNFGLNYAFIPEQGATGAAYATLITQVLTTGFQLYLTLKRFGASHFAKTGLQFVLFAAVIVLGGQFSPSFFIFLPLATILALIFRLWNLSEWKSLLPALGKGK